MKIIVLVVSVTTTALMAGLFYSWSISVTPGIARLSNSEYIAAMQAMNRAILNPVFLSCFLGTALLLPASSYLYYQPHPSARFWWLLAATLFYLAGVMGVTMFGNVPLNNSLDTFSLKVASETEIAARRMSFEGIWNWLNNIRTLSAVLALISSVVACLIPES